MSCEICGRGSCTKSFHSLEEQEAFESVADRVKERIKSNIERKINRLDIYLYEYDTYKGNPIEYEVVRLDEVLDAISEAD